MSDTPTTTAAPEAKTETPAATPPPSIKAILAQKVGMARIFDAHGHVIPVTVLQAGPSTHGQSDRPRAPGSSGSNTYPGRVYKGKRFPGHMGAERVTVQHLEVVQVIADKDLMLIKGAVPGTIESLLTIQETVKRMKK